MYMLPVTLLHVTITWVFSLVTGQLKLSAYMNYGLVTVHMMQGRQIGAESQRQPDSFVMITLIPEDTDVTPSRCRTDLARESSCPNYNEKFSL